MKNRKNIILGTLIIIAIMLGIALISNITRTRDSLDKIIYNAKVEAEKALISSGEMIYTKDIGAISNRQLSDANLPENTNSTQQGTVVAPKENWNIETVTGVSVGNGDTVPVPIGFYYVGGDLNTGVIISDNEEDQYDGTTDKTTWEYTTQLKGNQFVWIPCTEEEYKKSEVWNGIIQKTTGTTTTTGTLCHAGWDKTTYTSELPQIRKYGGFYVARYEAGLAKTITEFTATQQQTDLNQVYNLEGIPQAKAGVVPWMLIDWDHSQTNAKSMYNTASVSSGLITGTQWDVMLNKMVERGAIENSDLTSSVSWGNYSNNSIEYTGRVARAYGSGGRWYLAAFGGNVEGKTSSYSSGNGDLLTTGASRQTEKYHIYDVAGNLWEWTEEISLWKLGTANETNTQCHVLRSSCFTSASGIYPPCYRMGTCMNSLTSLDIGFRVVLYLK
ncbi:MAG: hypothetical protein HFJ18_00975 [Clostridia bacterium]|nr:hypothetical protein [Clostridia bacterium]